MDATIITTNSMDDSSCVNLEFEDHIFFQPAESMVVGGPLLMHDIFSIGKIISGTAIYSKLKCLPG